MTGMAGMSMRQVLNWLPGPAPSGSPATVLAGRDCYRTGEAAKQTIPGPDPGGRRRSGDRPVRQPTRRVADQGIPAILTPDDPPEAMAVMATTTPGTGLRGDDVGGQERVLSWAPPGGITLFRSPG